MDADGGWKKTLRNFGVEAKRAAERTAQAVSRMGMSEKNPDPDPAFKHLAEQYAEQTSSLKSIRDAASTAVEALARVAGTGASLATVLHSALPSGSSAITAAEKHVAAQRAITDGALRRVEQRIHSRIEAPVEEEIAASREIASQLDQRRKVASDYRRYRARLDDFTGNEGSEDAIKAEDKLRELNVLAESLTDQMIVAMPKRTSLLELCATELAEIFRDFHLEVASGLDGAIGLGQLPSTAAASDSTTQPVDDLFSGTPQQDILNSSSRPSKESVKPMSQADLLKAREQRRTKSAYTPPSHHAGSIWDENDPSSSAEKISPMNPVSAAAGVRDNRRPSARTPDYYGVANAGTTSSTIPEPLRRRGDASGYPTGGVGQRESSGYPSGGVGHRESVSSYPTAGVGQRESAGRDDYPSSGTGQKTSVYPSRRAPTTRAKKPEQKLPRSASRDSGIGAKSFTHSSDDLLGSFGGTTGASTPSEPQSRPPRQRRSTGHSTPTSTSNSLDDLFNFTGGGSGSNNNNSSGRAPTPSGSEGDLLGSFQSRPPRSNTRQRQKPSPPTSNASSSGPSPTNIASGTNLQREALKKKNEAEIKARAAEKLAAVRERENAKAAEQEKKDDSRSGAERKVLQWTGNGARRGNLRALLASLDTVLYPGNTWKPVPMDVLKVPAKVKLNYKKAILQVHPDKIGPKNLPPDQQVLAELIFDELQNGHEVFLAEQEGKPPPPGSVGPKKAAGGAGSGFQNPAGGMYAGMGRGMAGMGNMGGFGYGRGAGMGGFQNNPYQNAGMGRGMGGMGMGGMNGVYGYGRGTNAGRGNMAFGTGRAYGMGMNNQQRR